MIHPQAAEVMREIRLTHLNTPKAAQLLDRSIFLWSMYAESERAKWLSAVSSQLNAYVDARVEPERDDVVMLDRLFAEWEATCE